jgi:hypothetical protein
MSRILRLLFWGNRRRRVCGGQSWARHDDLKEMVMLLLIEKAAMDVNTVLVVDCPQLKFIADLALKMPPF